LVTAMDPGYTDTLAQAYIRLGIAADGARYADVIDIQAQRLEADSVNYTDFVLQARAQAKAANRKVLIFAGISANPLGMTVTSDQVLACIKATRSYVDGYWFNIPTTGSCPTCVYQPEIALQVIDALAAGA